MAWASLREMVAQRIGLILVAVVFVFGVCEPAAADDQVPGAGAPASDSSARPSATDPTRVARAPMPPPATTGSILAQSGTGTAEPNRATTFPEAVIQVYHA